MKTIIILAGIAGLAVTPVCTEHKLQKEITPGFCELVAHVPAADIAYEGGVDVHGKPVVEADLNPAHVTVPEKISFNVTIDMAKYLGLSLPAGTEGYANVGTVSYEKGTLSYNGEPMDGRAAQSLRDLCAVPPPAKDTQKDKQIKHNKD